MRDAPKQARIYIALKLIKGADTYMFSREIRKIKIKVARETQPSHVLNNKKK